MQRFDNSIGCGALPALTILRNVSLLKGIKGSICFQRLIPSFGILVGAGDGAFSFFTEVFFIFCLSLSSSAKVWWGDPKVGD